MADLNSTLTAALTPGAKRLVETALQKCSGAGQETPGVNHWLLALMERHAPMAEGMVQGLEAQSLLEYLRRQLAQQQAGAPLDGEQVVSQALARAQARGKTQATERDVAAVILQAGGYTLLEEPGTANPVITAPATAAPPAEGAPAGAAPASAATKPGWQPRSKRPTPTLERFGRDLTQAAAEGKLRPFVGRETEIQLVIETLCRRTKRNPVLVGPAGVGKTAIVEGLAQRIVRGQVPEVLKNCRVLALQPSTLIAGASLQGDVEKRMEAVVSEASQDGILLFIDEVHAIVGAGGRAGGGDIASLLKPALARGEIACIAATTDDEYRRYIEEDSALERRFQPLRIQELSAKQTLSVLQSLREDLTKTQGVRISPAVLEHVISLAERFLRNRHFPDKAVDLLEQSVAHAVAAGKPAVSIADADAVVRRLVGMPLQPQEQLDRLRRALQEQAILTQPDATALLNRLQVALFGLDVRPSRPSAVVLMLDHAAANGPALAEAVAETLFGAKERQVTIDFSRFTDEYHLSMLIGSPPGYVGYNENLPIYRVEQMPWCALLCTNMEGCHPLIRDVFQQALASGGITSATGKRIYLSDAVVIVTAHVGVEAHRAMGIRQHEEESVTVDARAAAQALGEGLVDECDLIVTQAPAAIHVRQWIEHTLLPDLAARYSRHGLNIHWDPSLIEWLAGHQAADTNARDWERLVDERLSPLLLPYLPKGVARKAQGLAIRA
ncbi:MAG TPA: AAA family ATPase, partial [Chthonomonadaceae bacterium]|nr:AAA family ATPase [Chthonomonadaceae bacterium]